MSGSPLTRAIIRLILPREEQNRIRGMVVYQFDWDAGGTMNCCQCQSIETEFDQKYVAKKLSQYRSKGPDQTTRLLLESLKAERIKGMTLLDIGGGVGAISNELLKEGLDRATHIEASPAYLEAAKDEAARQKHTDRVTFEQGNFVDLAADTLPADIVTLDRVICCYPDMQALVGLSAARAGKLYGVVYPRDTWWVRTSLMVENLFYKLRKSSFRVFTHSTEAVEAVVRSKGLRRRSSHETFLWQVIVYSR